MISRLGYAILALLARQPSTGYELSARARRPLGYFWSARHSQIYPELRKLLAQGLVRFTAGPGPGPRAKKVYSVTEAGLAALREWVIQPPEPAPSRDDLVLKAYAAWTADPAAAWPFAAQIAGHRDRLAAYEADWGKVQGRTMVGRRRSPIRISVTTPRSGAGSTTNDSASAGWSGSASSSRRMRRSTRGPSRAMARGARAARRRLAPGEPGSAGLGEVIGGLPAWVAGTSASSLTPAGRQRSGCCSGSSSPSS